MRKVNNYEIISLLMFINITMYLGININIIKKVIRKMGGYFTIKSKEGIGTWFSSTPRSLRIKIFAPSL